MSIELTRQEFDNLCQNFLKKIENILNALYIDAKNEKK